MYALSEEQQIALYVLWGIFRGMNNFSGVDIAFDKSKPGDGIDAIVSELKCGVAGAGSETRYFARFCRHDEIEVWSDSSQSLPDVIKSKVVEVVPDAVYSQNNGRHNWKSIKFKEWFDFQYKMIYDR